MVGSGVQQSDSVFSFIYIHIYSSSCSFPFWFTTGTEYSFLHCDLGPSCLSLLYMIASVQFSSVAQSRSILCDPMNRSSQASLSITNFRSSLRLTSIDSVMPSSLHLLISNSQSTPSVPPSPSAATGLFSMPVCFCFIDKFICVIF